MAGAHDFAVCAACDGYDAIADGLAILDAKAGFISNPADS
jgi:hypothetical protein